MLNYELEAAGLPSLDEQTAAKFNTYLELLLRWNSRMNLTAIRDPEEIVRRHFVESIACARELPSGITTLLDFGSGAGFPGIPIAICRGDIQVTLAESQAKKSAFLREAVRRLNLTAAVLGDRAENLGQQFDCVVLRAVDRMEQAIVAASNLVRPGGWLTVLTTKPEAVRLARIGKDVGFMREMPSPGSEKSVVVTFSKRVGDNG